MLILILQRYSTLLLLKYNLNLWTACTWPQENVEVMVSLAA